jgi:hypothetical protein
MGVFHEIPLDRWNSRKIVRSLRAVCKHCPIRHTRYSLAVVAGGIIIAVVMLLLLPVAVMLGGAIWSALLGWLLVDDGDRRAGSEAS